MLRSTLVMGAVAVASAFAPGAPAGLQLRSSTRATCATVQMNGGEIQKMDRGELIKYAAVLATPWLVVPTCTLFIRTHHTV